MWTRQASVPVSDGCAFIPTLDMPVLVPPSTLCWLPTQCTCHMVPEPSIYLSTPICMCVCGSPDVLPWAQVLAALSARSDLGVPVHIPYRDSKLTQLLWEGLRGDGRALMLACLGPLRQHAEESLNTLHFAGMALRIKSQPIMLLDPAVRCWGPLGCCCKGTTGIPGYNIS